MQLRTISQPQLSRLKGLALFLSAATISAHVMAVSDNRTGNMDELTRDEAYKLLQQLTRRMAAARGKKPQPHGQPTQ